MVGDPGIGDAEQGPWQGDWRSRLDSKLASLGYRDVQGFLDERQGIGYVEIAKSLGDARIAATQINGEQLRSALQSNSLRDAAKDSLMRFIVEYVPQGWRTGKHFPHRSAAAFAAWATSIDAIVGEGSDIPPKTVRVCDVLAALPIPDGWLPRTSHDDYLEEAFAIGWPLDGVPS